jgi:hypothetical protein
MKTEKGSKLLIAIKHFRERPNANKTVAGIHPRQGGTQRGMEEGEGK